MKKQTMQEREVGPREVGGRYLSGYWQQRYEVVAITTDGLFGWSMTVKWDDGRTGTHSTAWDKKRDRVCD